MRGRKNLPLFCLHYASRLNSGVERQLSQKLYGCSGSTPVIGSFLSTDPAALAKAFETIASRVEAYTKSFYLMSYCSPARAQEHDLKVETGSGLSKGDLSYHFDATGFGPNCDSNRMPKFDIHRPIIKKK